MTLTLDQNHPVKSQGQHSEPAAVSLTPALVREVTELVYAQWLRELQIEQERSRLGTMHRHGR